MTFEIWWYVTWFNVSSRPLTKYQMRIQNPGKYLYRIFFVKMVNGFKVNYKDIRTQSQQVFPWVTFCFTVLFVLLNT